MKTKSVLIGRWTYSPPQTKPDPEGHIVLIKMLSFGSLEVYEWGIDADGVPYEAYKWVENDFFADENDFRHITQQELTEQIGKLINLLTKHGFSEQAGIYHQILERLHSDFTIDQKQEFLSINL